MTFTYKRYPSGSVIGHKSPFSYPGNRLTAGMHYEAQDFAVFSADLDCVRLMIAIATAISTLVRHLDPKIAFIHEPYDGFEEIIFEQMPTFDPSETSAVSFLRVQKKIYGMPQTLRTYAFGIVQHFTAYSCEQRISDKKVYIKRQGPELLILK